MQGARPVPPAEKLQKSQEVGRPYEDIRVVPDFLFVIYIGFYKNDCFNWIIECEDVSMCKSIANNSENIADGFVGLNRPSFPETFP